jgi:DNA polymerase III subunit gamma/tau
MNVQAITESDAGQSRALYRRWRAQRFTEVIGQDPIVTTLRQAVGSNRVAHAYLFVGPRGTGKTSTARILAKAINCTDRSEDGEPCDQCSACVSIRDGRAMDVIEIDAASHGLVEDARDLVMRALTAPSELRRRVYIIDEVHMLSTHAFNALLKLIEEPPDHVVFILATTDTHKVPATVISRTQRFDFRRIPDGVVAAKLERICAAEGRSADAEALALIARLADGSMRDAESLLDQVMAYAGERIEAATVREAVGLADDVTVSTLLDALVRGDTPAALGNIAALSDAGRDLAQIAAQAEAEARARLLQAASDPQLARRLATVLRSLAEAAGVGAREGRARLILELLSVEPAVTTGPLASAEASSAPVRVAPSESKVAETSRAGAAAAAAAPTPEAAAREASKPAATPSDAGGVEEPGPVDRPELAVLRTRWAEVVERATPVIKPLLRECRPVALHGARLTLAFPEGRDFIRSRISARADAIEQLLGSIFGGGWAIECVATNVELEPLSVEDALGGAEDDAEARALLEGVLKITGGELVDVPDVR